MICKPSTYRLGFMEPANPEIPSHRTTDMSDSSKSDKPRDPETSLLYVWDPLTWFGVECRFNSSSTTISDYYLARAVT